MRKSYSESFTAGISWEKFDKDEFSYNADGDLDMKTSYIWGDVDWVLDTKFELVYNGNYTNRQILMPIEYVDDLSFSYMLKEADSYVWGNDWTSDEKFEYYYSEVDVNGTHQLSTSGLQVYPNPSKGVFNVKIGGMGQQFMVSIVDISGSLIQQEQVTNANPDSFTKSFDLSRLNSGIYFIKLSNDTKSIFQKMVIE